MRKVFFTICVLFAFICVAAPKSKPATNASLNGTYSFQVTGVHQDSWGFTQTCSDSQGFPHSTFVGGQTVDTNSSVGTATFDGSGKVTGTITSYGQFDQSASNATVVLSCTEPTDNGHAVYKAPSTVEFSGTYIVQPDGTGTMTLSSGDGFVLKLAGQDKGINSTVLMTVLNFDNSVAATGLAVLE